MVCFQCHPFLRELLVFYHIDNAICAFVASLRVSSTINSLSRTESLKTKIRSLWSPAIIIDDFLTPQEMVSVKESFSLCTSKENHKGQNNNTLNIIFPTEQTLPAFYLNKVREHIKNFNVKNIFAFDSNAPFLLHTDSGLKTETIPYKNLTFCLEENNFEEQLILFNAYAYFSTSITTFDYFSYSKETLENYNYLLSTPEDFVSSANVFMPSSIQEPLTNAERKHLLRHIPEKHTQLFMIKEIIKYHYNRMIIFDSCQLHSGSSQVSVELIGKPKRLVTFTEKNDNE